jgi:Effector-associated domain 5
VSGRLAPELVDQLIQVAVELEFWDRRSVLLLRISRNFQGTMPMARGERMRDQLMLDLNYLNEAGILTDGSDPLRIWLSNAVDAAGGVQEEEVFRRALTELDRQVPETSVQAQPSLDSLIDEITGRGATVPPRLTLADLRPVIEVAVKNLVFQDQVRTVVLVSGLTDVRYPVSPANARDLWVAVFAAALDAPPETLALLLTEVSGSLGARPKADLEAALREVGRRLGDGRHR